MSASGRHTFALAVPPSNSQGVRASNGVVGARERIGTLRNARERRLERIAMKARFIVFRSGDGCLSGLWADGSDSVTRERRPEPDVTPTDQQGEVRRWRRGGLQAERVAQYRVDRVPVGRVEAS